MSFFDKNKVLLYWSAISKNQLFKLGVPFFALVLGGSFYLKQFTSLRYEYAQTSRNLKPEEIEGLMKLKKPEEVTLESEYEKLKEVDIDNWTNKRGPRPWEVQTED